MATRADHLDDIKDRLLGKIAQVNQRVYVSRVKTLDPAKHLPAICLYGPAERSGQALVTGGHAQFRPTHTLAIEVRVQEADGFDVLAGEIVGQILTILFTDPAWTTRFKPHPTYEVKQFLDRRGEQSFCGEVLTLTVEDKRPTAWSPVGPALTGVTGQADLDGDGEPELTTTAETPSP
ncbi:MAG: hypothetical protein HQL42_13105 [Alphaproteobacteria bacterium]|nr:hypothetical protein [Alphaproteobacteria bacterium]